MHYCTLADLQLAVPMNTLVQLSNDVVTDYSAAAPELDQGQPLIGQLAQVRGSSLLAMARDDFSDKTTRLEARALLRVWLTGLLGAEPLASRELLQAINALSD